MKNRKILISALGIVVSLVLGIAVAYAALSSTLNAKFNSVTQSALSWNVTCTSSDWDKPANSTTVSGSGGDYCGIGTTSSNGITVDSLTLSKDKSYCSYGFNIDNNGNINARVSSITPLKPNDSCTTNEDSYGITMTCGNIKYELKQVSINTEITGGSSHWAQLDVSYVDTSDSAPPVSVQSDGGFQLSFTQA